MSFKIRHRSSKVFDGKDRISQRALLKGVGVTGLAVGHRTKGFRAAPLAKGQGVVAVDAGVTPLNARRIIT